MNEKELLTGILTKIHNKTSEEIEELLYDKSSDSDEVTLKESALDLVLDEDVKRVEKFKSSAKPDKDELKSIRDRTIKEVMEDFEKKLKGKYGIESTSKGLDLVQEAVNTVSECDITDDKVKNHFLYLELESNSVKKEDYDALHTEYEEFKLNQDRTTTFSRVERDILGVFAKLNPIESQNPVVAQTRREDFLRKFEPYDYELQENGNHLILQNEKRMEDKHGHPIKFYDFVQGVAALNYEFAVSTDKGNAGNTGNGSGSRLDVPKDEREYLAKMTELMQKGDKEGQQKLYQAWQESKNR